MKKLLVPLVAIALLAVILTTITLAISRIGYVDYTDPADPTATTFYEQKQWGWPLSIMQDNQETGQQDKLDRRDRLVVAALIANLVFWWVALAVVYGVIRLSIRLFGV